MEENFINPALSVVIPMYNAEKTVAKTLDSIFKNTFKNFEVIVVDDGSTDHSAEIVKKYPIQIFQQKNAGASKARNCGVAKARAEIIVFTDADIIIPDFTLEKIQRAYATQTGLEVLAGMPDSLNHYNNKFSDYENLYIHYQFNKQKNTTTAFYTSLVAIKKSVFQKLNGFDERIAIIEDMDFGQKLLNAGHIIYLDKNLAFSHLKNFTLRGYIKKQIQKDSGIMKIKLRTLKHGQINKKCFDASWLFQLGVPISLLVLLNLVLALFFWSIAFIYFAVGISILLIVMNWKMLSYLGAKRNFDFLIFSCLFLIFNYWFYALGLGYGFVTFLAGQEF